MSKLNPTAFLDRDGTINRDLGYVAHPKQIELLPGAARAIRRLNRQGILVVVVTNQSGIARGLFTEETLTQIHEHLKATLAIQGAHLDAIYYCPHHPTIGKPPYKRACRCRKPQTGLIETAAQELPIDLSRSALFGDSPRDIETAQRANLPAYLLGQSTVPTPENCHVAANLEAAVNDWLQTSQIVE